MSTHTTYRSMESGVPDGLLPASLGEAAVAGVVAAVSADDLVVMSDAASTDAFTFATGATLTFDDAAGAALPLSGAITSGTYRPTNRSLGSADSFPPPAGADAVE